MVFWASLPPWPRLYSAADNNCSCRNQRSTLDGVERRQIQDTATISSPASRKPSVGGAFGIVDAPRVMCGLREIRHQADQFLAAFDGARRMRVEKIKKAALAGISFENEVANKDGYPRRVY